MCYRCSHRKEPFGGYDVGFTCTAFPEGIPSEILQSEFDHRKPHEGDHGFQFEGTLPPYFDEIFTEVVGSPRESDSSPWASSAPLGGFRQPPNV
jgi:hypothetical protein